MQVYVDDIYNNFVSIVAQGRDKTFESVDSIAQGRVWTGTDALKIGLVDEIGTLEDFLPLCDAARVHRLDGNGFTLTKEAPAGIVVPRFAE